MSRVQLMLRQRPVQLLLVTNLVPVVGALIFGGGVSTLVLLYVFETWLAILFLAASNDTAWQGISLLFAYSLGIGLPFLAAALFAKPFLGMMGRAKRHMHTIEKAMGGLLVVTGVLFMTGQMSTMAFWLLELFPALETIG